MMKENIFPALHELDLHYVPLCTAFGSVALPLYNNWC